MTTFPEIQPSSREFAAGQLPVSMFNAVSGKETRVIHGDTFAGHKVTLEFKNIQEQQAKRIIDHWYGQQGTALAFPLSASVFAGWSAYTSAVTAGQLWRYEEQPQVVAVAPAIMTVSVVLLSLA